MELSKNKKAVYKRKLYQRKKKELENLIFEKRLYQIATWFLLLVVIGQFILNSI